LADSRGTIPSSDSLERLHLVFWLWNSNKQEKEFMVTFYLLSHLIENHTVGEKVSWSKKRKKNLAIHCLFPEHIDSTEQSQIITGINDRSLFI
jgi:hypothetical protein